MTRVRGGGAPEYKLGHTLGAVPASLHRDKLFADRTLVGSVFCRAYSRRVDEWLIDLYDSRVGDDDRFALTAIGGYGRSTLFPQSDLDLMLVHDDVSESELADAAQKLWYPIWDEGLKLGHSARTPREAVDLAKTDLDTATSLIALRHLAGGRALTTRLAETSEVDWRKQAQKWLPALEKAVRTRRRENGEVAFLLEPDLKESGGGLRDVNAIHWAHAAGIELLEPERRALTDANETIMAARVELHRTTGRPSNRLLLEDQEAVAEALGLGDADDLMADISASARTISFLGAEVWSRAGRSTERRFVFFSPSNRAKEVAPHVLLQGGTIQLAPDAPITTEPLLLLHAMVAAAKHESRIGWPALERLLTMGAKLPEPWPAEARELFADLLLTGRAAIPVVEAVEQFELFSRLLPEWAPNRCKPQRNAYHLFTVDRHLLEAAAEASTRTDMVSRPDLLVVGALLHDIGKGYPGDHTIVGMELVDTIARRMGYSDGDVASLVAMVEHHLLLPDVATRRDIEDDETIDAVADQVGSVGVLRLLGALTESDSIATGPSAWSSWKASLVRDLVRRTEQHLAGEPLASRAFPTDDQLALMVTHDRVIRGDGTTLTVIVPDDRGIFSKTVGALAINGLKVLGANVHTDSEMALHQITVESPEYTDLDWARVTADVAAAHDGSLPIDERLAERARTYMTSGTTAAVNIVDKSVTFDNDLVPTQTIVEVACQDSLGLLYRITSTLAELGLDLHKALIQTLNEDVVDSFYVQAADGGQVTDPGQLVAIEQRLLLAIDSEEMAA